MEKDAPLAATAIALVGIGKIARDQHIPTIEASGAFRLAATVTRHNAIDGLPNFASIAALHAAMPEIAAVSICTPPRGRLDLVREAFNHGLDVMLEKPPAASLSEAEAIVAAGRNAGRVLYVTWHSREAAGVAPARAWLVGKRIVRTNVSWKEDVRVWHPGQEWIWEPGIGVFDPGVNALSILTALLPGPLRLDRSVLSFPADRSAPIAADLKLTDAAGAPVAVALDFDQRGAQTWDIAIETDKGALTLTQGGAKLAIDGRPIVLPHESEYARLYAQFAALRATGESDTDLAPFRLVADAFVLGERHLAGPFAWDAPVLAESAAG